MHNAPLRCGHATNPSLPCLSVGRSKASAAERARSERELDEAAVAAEAEEAERRLSWKLAQQLAAREAELARVAREKAALEAATRAAAAPTDDLAALLTPATLRSLVFPEPLDTTPRLQVPLEGEARVSYLQQQVVELQQAPRVEHEHLRVARAAAAREEAAAAAERKRVVQAEGAMRQLAAEQKKCEVQVSIFCVLVRSRPKLPVFVTHHTLFSWEVSKTQVSGRFSHISLDRYVPLWI